MAAARGVPVLVVEVPMPAAYASTPAAIPSANPLRSELKRLRGSASAQLMCPGRLG